MVPPAGTIPEKGWCCGQPRWRKGNAHAASVRSEWVRVRGEDDPFLARRGKISSGKALPRRELSRCEEGADRLELLLGPVEDRLGVGEVVGGPPETDEPQVRLDLGEAPLRFPLPGRLPREGLERLADLGDLPRDLRAALL